MWQFRRKLDLHYGCAFVCGKLKSVKNIRNANNIRKSIKYINYLLQYLVGESCVQLDS